MTKITLHTEESIPESNLQASKELWRVGFAVALGGRIATFFTPLAPKQRGVAAVLALTSTILVAIGFLGVSIFT